MAASVASKRHKAREFALRALYQWQVTGQDVGRLRELSRAAGGRWIGGMCLYRGDRIHRLAERGIWAVPSYRLFG